MTTSARVCLGRSPSGSRSIALKFEDPNGLPCGESEAALHSVSATLYSEAPPQGGYGDKRTSK